MLCTYIKNPRMVFVGRNQSPFSSKPLPWPGTPSPETQTLQCCCSFGKPLIIKKMFVELIQAQSRCCLGTEQLPAWLFSCQTGGSLAGQEQQPSWQQKNPPAGHWTNVDLPLLVPQKGLSVRAKSSPQKCTENAGFAVFLLHTALLLSTAWSWCPYCWEERGKLSAATWEFWFLQSH